MSRYRFTKINKSKTSQDKPKSYSKYDTTIYTEEALYRLVEVHYILGLEDEARKYAALLGYNYQSSKWYENSYSLFDKTYEKRKKERFKTYKKKGGGLLKKFKTLLEWDGKK